MDIEILRSFSAPSKDSDNVFSTLPNLTNGGQRYAG
jgi:hypothetical protein